ncbi:MAG: hypothetical protein HYT70_01510 [Candidatus Aenigmarchaeota archaeon]|nr:hypothetical protein [Candidatus Aenigmarchaeota archaeon]
MSNGFRGKIGNGLIEGHNEFLKDQLVDAQQSLFFARSVKEMQFLQNRINYLKQRLNEVKLGSNRRKRR